MSQSIFSFIKSYIPTESRDPKEDFLTQILAWLLINVEGFAKSYCQFLLSHAKEPQFSCNRDEEYHIETQITVNGGRIDLLIKVDNNGFICEHKLLSNLGDNQIKKYLANSQALGAGYFHTVLITFSKHQHSQDADIMITWSDVYEFAEQELINAEGTKRFVLLQFVKYMKEQGLGKYKVVEPEAIVGYFPAMTLANSLENIFGQLATKDWTKDCPNLKAVDEKNYVARYNSMRWGRKGIDFFDQWYPNIFIGVLLTIADHQLKPLDIYKGPDVVLFVETHYNKKDLELMKKRNAILSAEAFLSSRHGFN